MFTRLSVLLGMMMVLFGCAARQVVPPSPQFVEFQDQLDWCMREQPCDDDQVFAEDWGDRIAGLSPTKKLLRAAERLNPEKTARCMHVLDNYMEWRQRVSEEEYLRLSRHEEVLQTRYSLDNVKRKRGMCMATYHTVMQGLILTSEPLELATKRMSRAKLVVNYSEELEAFRITPSEVKIQPAHLVSAYQLGIKEDHDAVMKKTGDRAELCALIIETDKRPPHNLSKSEVDRLQCSTVEMTAARSNQPAVPRLPH